MKKELALSFLVLCLLGVMCSSSAAAVNWKWVHYQPVDSMADKLSKSMIAEIEEKSGGQIKFSLFPA